MVQSGDGAGRLGFTDVALHAFDFLREFGFSPVRVEETIVRFESKSVFVTVFHGRGSYQLNVEIGRLVGREWYNLAELLGPAAVRGCQVTTRPMLEQCLRHFGEMLRQQLVSLLRDEPGAFDAARELVAPKRRALTLKYQYGATLDRADRAWEEHNWTTARRLYRESEPVLDTVRTARLRYLNSKERSAPR